MTMTDYKRLWLLMGDYDWSWATMLEYWRLWLNIGDYDWIWATLKLTLKAIIDIYYRITIEWIYDSRYASINEFNTTVYLSMH